jgi:hypothetical protein
MAAAHDDHIEHLTHEILHAEDLSLGETEVKRAKCFT